MWPLTVGTDRNHTVLNLDCMLDEGPNKNFRIFEFLELFKNFCRVLTNYFLTNVVQEPVLNQLRSHALFC